MKPARILILATALAAGIGAAFMVAGSKPPPAVRLVMPGPPAVPMAEVLVAAKNIQFGGVIVPEDMRWQKWPRASVPPGVILKSAMPGAVAEFKGSLTRDPIGAGEPFFADRLIQPGKASFMAAILPAGSRAVAINIDQQGATTAGGFILPGDHVDVIHTFKDDEAARAGGDGMVSETILRNIRVLAIGQNNGQQGDQKVDAGSNATLELTPRQVEKIILAQRVGQLSLSLRSMADTSATQTQDEPPPAKPTNMTIVRFGVPVQTHAH